jgi:ABC-type polysaccharide/polyol phosphate export permease
MSVQSMVHKFKINPDFYPLSSLVKLLAVIIAPAIFLAISGRSSVRISWYFLLIAFPFFLLSLGIGFMRFTKKPEADLSIR